MKRQLVMDRSWPTVAGIAMSLFAVPWICQASDVEYGRYVDKTADWEQVGGDLLSGFLNMYNLHVIHEPDDAAYPYKGWFFGWATTVCNEGYPGCDAIFAARAAKLVGPWEVYCGDVDRQPVWGNSMKAARWVPVISGGSTNFDNWHNGDPTVVRRDGKYYIIYSATGHNADGIAYGQPEDTDSDISCIMGAVSEDGLHWVKSNAPVLVYQPNVGQPPESPGGYTHPSGLYHRPSLMYEDGRWKAWFDSYTEQHFAMLYAENAGDFAQPADWKVMRGMDNPCIREFPNPDVVKIEDVYFVFADPGGHPDAGWATRKTTWAVSLNGRDWKMVGYMKADSDVQANHVPEAYVESEDGVTWIYLTYGAQVPNDYRYDRIRMKRWKVTSEELARLRALCKDASGPVEFERWR
jgi:hypothetical protein